MKRNSSAESKQPSKSHARHRRRAKIPTKSRTMVKRITFRVDDDGRTATFEEALDDHDIRQMLDEHRKGFESGNRIALWRAICFTGKLGIPQPDWIVDAQRDINNGIREGKFRDFNAAFGFKPAHQSKLKKQQRMTSPVGLQIYDELANARLCGEALVDATFYDIGQKLNVATRFVKTVFQCHKVGLRKLRRGGERNPDHHVLAITRTFRRIRAS